VFGFEELHTIHQLFRHPKHAVVSARAHLLSTAAVISMFANRLAVLLFITICSFQGYATAAWDEVPQSAGNDGTWSKVECQPGVGWQKCIKAPVKVCLYDSNNYYTHRPYCRGGGSFQAYVRNGVLYGNPRPPAVSGSHSYGGPAPSSFSIGALVGKVLDGCAGNPEPRYIYQICITE
jgi:hypothetical protein